MTGGSLLGLTDRSDGDPVAIKYTRDVRLPFFIIGKIKSGTSLMLAAGNLISEMYDSWKAFPPWTVQISSRKHTIGKINLPYKIMKYLLKPIVK